MTLNNPTRSSKEEYVEPTSEAETWPEMAAILKLVGLGITYTEALAMSPSDTRRYLAIASSWSIPAKQRVGGTRMATAADKALLAM